jgi:hypothetical protein
MSANIMIENLICLLCGRAVVKPLLHARTGRWRIKCYVCSLEVQHKQISGVIQNWIRQGRELIEDRIKETDIQLRTLKARLERFEEKIEA